MQMNTVAKVSTHVVCPSCHQPDATIDHLNGQHVSTMWYCSHCGKRYALTVMPDLTVQHLRPTGEYIEKALVLLRHDKVGLVVEGMVFHDLKDEDHGHAYLYNEHTCPTNFMPQVRAVINLGDKDVDPHGIFQYVTTLPWDEKVNECDNHDFLSNLVPYFIDPPLSLAE